MLNWYNKKLLQFVDLGFYKGGCSIHLKGARPAPIILTHVTGTKQFFGLRRNSWRQAVIRHLELHVCQIPYKVPIVPAACVFTKHHVQLKTVTTCFQNMFFSKKGTETKGRVSGHPLDPPLNNEQSTTQSCSKVSGGPCAELRWWAPFDFKPKIGL